MPASDGLRRREVRRTVRAIAVTAALSALALLSGAAPLGGQAPSSTTKAPAAVLAITGGGWIPQRLVRLDALTLRRLPGKAVRLGAETAGSAFSPDRSRVAIGGPAWQGVRIVDVRRMRLLGTVRPTARRGGGELIPLAWLGKDRLCALAWPAPRLLTIDAGKRRIVASRALEGEVDRWAATGTRLVLLLAPTNRIGPARLEVVDANGSAATVSLDAIPAGSVAEAAEPYTMRLSAPGLAVDPAGDLAFVVGSGDRVAQVELGSGRVAYHDVHEAASLLTRLGAWLEPTAEAKVVSGPVRDSRWLGDDLLVVSGVDYHPYRDANGDERVRTAPAGLALIHTKTWSKRVLDARATGFAVAGDVVLAFAATTGEDGRPSAGMGVAGFGFDGERRFALLGREPVWRLPTSGTYAYVPQEVVPESVRVLDAAEGRVVRTAHRRLPTLLIP